MMSRIGFFQIKLNVQLIIIISWLKFWSENTFYLFVLNKLKKASACNLTIIFNMLNKLRDWLIGTLRTITIEPVIFFFLIGNFILFGAQIPTNILIYKVSISSTFYYCFKKQDHFIKKISNSKMV